MRSWLSVPRWLVPLLLPLMVLGEQPRVQLLVQSSPLAGYRYGEGAEVWPLLREGDALELVPEPGNVHDANAVRVEWRGRKLGYVPRRQNAALAWGLERGTPLRARVSRLVEHPNPARRIEFEVYIE
jgi:HIRAN domain